MYVICDNEQPVMICTSLADAEEAILSLVEETTYYYYCWHALFDDDNAKKRTYNLLKYGRFCVIQKVSIY